MSGIEEAFPKGKQNHKSKGGQSGACDARSEQAMTDRALMHTPHLSPLKGATLGTLSVWSAAAELKTFRLLLGCVAWDAIAFRKPGEPAKVAITQRLVRQTSHMRSLDQRNGSCISHQTGAETDRIPVSNENMVAAQTTADLQMEPLCAQEPHASSPPAICTRNYQCPRLAFLPQDYPVLKNCYPLVHACT